MKFGYIRVSRDEQTTLLQEEGGKGKEMKRLRDRFIESIGQMENMSTDQMKKQPIAQWVYGAEEFVFGPSTIRMLVEKVDHFEETLEELSHLQFPETYEEGYSFREGYMPVQGAWITFQNLAWNVHAFFLSPNQEKTPHHFLFLIGEDATLIECLGINEEMELYYLLHFHTCPSCQWKQETCLPCAECKQVLFSIAAVLIISSILIGQCLAERRYEEETVSTTLRVARKNSKKKTRVIHGQRTIKVIDVSEIVVKLPVLPLEEEQGQKHASSHPITSWIDEDTEYKHIRTRPFTRHYRSPYYKNMQGQTREFEFGVKRRQPYKPKKVGETITYTKAARYEQQQEEGKEREQ